jgi:hypothetical protein
VAVCPGLCVGKKGKKEVKTLGSPPGALDKIFFLIKFSILLHQKS